ncbi:MAG: hypothetical protein ACI9KE_004348 [Polyangiales bacterium]|jgi:hypothetical protein
MRGITPILFVLALTACAEDTRNSSDGAVLPDAPVIDSGPGVDGGPADGDMDGGIGVMDLCSSTAPADPIDVNARTRTMTASATTWTDARTSRRTRTWSG